MNAVRGAAFAAVKFNVQNASFQARMKLSSNVEAMPGMDNGNRILMISSQSLAPSIRAASKISLDFGEIGVEHPDNDRQVDQHQNEGQAQDAIK